MKTRSRGVGIKYYKHGESSIIAKILTEEYGMLSFIAKGVRSKNSKKKISHFEPLKLVSIDFTLKPKNSLHFLSDITFEKTFVSLEKQMTKNFLAVYIAEILLCICQEGEKNKTLFDFVWSTSDELFSKNSIEKNLILKFMLKTTHYLGFFPDTKTLGENYFDLESGSFVNSKLLKGLYMSKENTFILSNLLKNKELDISKSEQDNFLDEFFQYFKIHHYNLDKVTSHKVIRSLR